MTVADAITAFSALLAAASFAWGINAWRREFVGRRRIELAEEVLAKFYEARDLVGEIRSPFSNSSEGKSRESSPHELKEESAILNRAYVVVERYKARKSRFAELRATKYKLMAAFGSDAGEPYDLLEKALRRVFVAAEMLGSHYWLRQGRVEMSDDEHKQHLKEMRKHQSDFWITSEEEDEVGGMLDSAIQHVERIAQKAVGNAGTR